MDEFELHEVAQRSAELEAQRAAALEKRAKIKKMMHNNALSLTETACLIHIAPATLERFLATGEEPKRVRARRCVDEFIARNEDVVERRKLQLVG